MINRILHVAIATFAIFACLQTLSPSHAQEMPAEQSIVTPQETVLPDNATTTTAETQPETALTIEQQLDRQIIYMKPSIDLDNIESLFLTPGEHNLIRNARRGQLSRAPGDDDGVEVTGPRELALGGIVYRSAKDWTIWLNNSQLSPKNLLSEIIDLKVYKDHIDLEWFDASTNQVFPIRLRAHQRFNLDTRMFLPGQGTDATSAVVPQ